MAKIGKRPAHKRVEAPIPQRIRHLTKEQSAQLIADYHARMPVKDIATKFNLHPSSVSLHLKSHGVPPRIYGLDPRHIPEAVKLYAQGASLKVVGQRFGADKETVRKRLVEAGVQMRSAFNHTVHY